jgi:FemAB-related protein (PEP-CTERM system-associated)
MNQNLEIRINRFTEEKIEEWDSYVANSAHSSVYHLSKWKAVVEKSFGHKTFYLMAENKKGIEGLLPLVLLSSKLFGKFLVSLPFFNYGGICAESKEAMDLLLREAINIAQEEKAEHIELRHSSNYNLSLPAKETKVAMVLEINANPGNIWDKLDPKVRNQVRKAEKVGLKVIAGGRQGLDDFYKIFTVNMRDLGTPVYGREFFRSILNEFPENTKMFSVYLDNRVIASSLVIGFKDTLEVPWAASLGKYSQLCPNMLLYWKMIEYACLQGYKYFDFGRSSWDSGTFKFKKQWGAKPKQLYWQYWLSNRNQLPEINPNNPKYKLAIKVWQHTPVFITKLIGPHIVKNIP